MVLYGKIVFDMKKIVSDKKAIIFTRKTIRKHIAFLEKLKKRQWWSLLGNERVFNKTKVLSNKKKCFS